MPVDAIVVTANQVVAMFNDQVGVCLRCGGLHNPIPNEAVCKPCEGCGFDTVVGMKMAVEVGAVHVDMERAA